MAIYRVEALAHVEVMVEASSEDEAGWRVTTGQVENPIEILDVFDIDSIEEIATNGTESEV